MGRTSAAVKNRYNSKAYDRINIIVPKGEKDRYKAIAEAQGKSLNQLFVEAVEAQIAASAD